MNVKKEIKHGTESGYSKGGCRCEACKKAKADYRFRNPIAKHGTTWGYDKGCRCEPCKGAKKAEWKKRHPDTRGPSTDIENQTRKCTICGVVKPLEEFTKNIREFLGRDYRCRICRNRIAKGHKNTPVQRFSTYRCGARTRGIPFALSFERFTSFWDKPCFYCGDAINGIGLDRKDPALGYSMENVVPCCCRCNRAKTIQTTEDFISMCQKVAEKFNNHIVSPVSSSL